MAMLARSSGMPWQDAQRPDKDIRHIPQACNLKGTMSCSYTRTVCPPRSFLHVAPVRGDQGCGLVAASDGWLHVYEILEDGDLSCAAQQPVHGTVRALETVHVQAQVTSSSLAPCFVAAALAEVVPSSQRTLPHTKPGVVQGGAQQAGSLALLTDSDYLAILRWDACFERWHGGAAGGICLLFPSTRPADVQKAGKRGVPAPTQPARGPLLAAPGASPTAPL
jgi:hypothetical protein